MKRYWLFGGDTFYPLGGLEDFLDSFDTPEQAVIAGSTYEWKSRPNEPQITSPGKVDWYQVYDSHTNEVIANRWCAHGVENPLNGPLQPRPSNTML